MEPGDAGGDHGAFSGWVGLGGGLGFFDDGRGRFGFRDGEAEEIAVVIDDVDFAVFVFGEGDQESLRRAEGVLLPAFFRLAKAPDHGVAEVSE